MADWSELGARHVRGYVRTTSAWEAVEPSTVRRLAHRQGWERPHRAVVHLGPVVEDHRNALAAAVVRLAGPHGAPVALSGWTALFLNGLVGRLASTVELTMEHRRRAPKLARVKVRRSRTFSPHQVVDIDGLPVLGVPWLLVSMAGRVNEEILRGWLLDVRQRRLATFEQVTAAAREMGCVPGLPRLRRLTGELEPSGADSPFEDRMRARLLEAGFAPDEGQAEVEIGKRKRYIDIPFSAQMVGIECHSMAFHSSRSDLEEDAVRQSELAIAGWLIIIATWRDLGSGWDAFRRRLRQALDQRS